MKHCEAGVHDTAAWSARDMAPCPADWHQLPNRHRHPSLQGKAKATARNEAMSIPSTGSKRLIASIHTIHTIHMGTRTSDQLHRRRPPTSSLSTAARAARRGRRDATTWFHNVLAVDATFHSAARAGRAIIAAATTSRFSALSPTGCASSSVVVGSLSRIA
ncbi:hypothetical protein T440DRAFT_212247 [Plenodomus tracheiphilus IPT5]|uniref:Uncharacterized protein n=1 Tax=Plenodomus tracheiphilus IPT5 TaxID=1408161 RepID=A0A6A7AVH9_9PLEO|nr:hypothetical protein T440DRAFT_212247 [Plenodomus tracheiphilus IPT5]